jgi:hypothetical protein
MDQPGGGTAAVCERSAIPNAHSANTTAPAYANECRNVAALVGSSAR